MVFKQIGLTSISIFISYFITNFILNKNYCKFYFIDGIIKYPLNCKIKNASKVIFSDIKNTENFIFYTLLPINCDNYIYDILNDNYYLIESGYYYYIKNYNNILLNYNLNSDIFYLKLK